MRALLCGSLILTIVGSTACSESTPAAASDPIPDIPAAQQRSIDRTDLDWQWPFTVGRGTLGCIDGAVVFRHEGRNYAVNKAASSRGYSRVQPIWRSPTPGPPTNPLTRINQDQRQTIFGEAMRCEGSTLETKAASGPCKQNIRTRHQLTDAELAQIEAEGHERLWPPLERPPAPLEPLTEIGLKLCQAK